MPMLNVLFGIRCKLLFGFFLNTMFLDIFTTILGLIYILLEYKASIWLWLVGVLMPALDILLYWEHGLYGDAALAVYYTVAGIYGFLVWRFGRKYKTTSKLDDESKANVSDMPITHMKRKYYLPAIVFFFAAWGATWYLLKTYTNSTVPVLDGFTNALSFVGLWALARKYIEQWFFWIVVDVISCYLYVGKGIPFKAGLYGLYVVIAVAGYFKWKKQVVSQKKIVILPSKS